MKYRPIGATGAAVSSLCLSIGYDELTRGQAALKRLIIASLEAGINAYHFDIAHPSLLQAAGEALSHVERELLWVSLSLGGSKSDPDKTLSFAPEHLTRTVEEGLHTSGLGWFDVAVLNDPAERELPLSSLNALKALRSSGHVRLLGIKGEAQVMDTYISTGAFDALYTPSSLNNDWPIRSRLREAQKRDMAVFIYDYDRDVRPGQKAETQPTSGKKGLLGWMGLGATSAKTDTTSFDFLHTTPGWSAAELCLSLALTDPAVSSALISVKDTDDLTRLAQTVERHLPSRLAAQIEIARVS